MITQKAISAKVYASLLDEVDIEAHTTARKRNHIINIALRMYLDYMDEYRRSSYMGPQYEKKAMENLWLRYSNISQKQPCGTQQS